MSTVTKEEVQKRVLKDGKLLDLDLFSWDENTGTFSSNENDLVLDFNGLNNCTFDTSSYCTFKTGSHCTFNAGLYSTFKTGSHCTFDTGSGCTFDTGSDCTFKIGSYCTFKTGSRCTFDTGSRCTFDTGSHCVVVRRDVFEFVHLKENQRIQLCPYDIKGYLIKVNNKFNYSEDLNKENEYIIVDDILSRVISRKGNILKVKNYNETKESYIIQDGDLYSHGETIKEAKGSLVYKISSRDASMYKDLTLDSILSKDECIRMYRVITGACENGTKYFVSKQEPIKIKNSYTIKELIELTEGQYGNDKLVQFLKGE